MRSLSEDLIRIALLMTAAMLVAWGVFTLMQVVHVSAPVHSSYVTRIG